MFIPDVINTLLMGLIFIVIVVTVVRPIMLNLVHTQVDGDDIQKMVNQEVNKHLIRHFQDAAAQRTAEIRFQKLLLDVPKKPERDLPDPELDDDEEEVVPAPVAAEPEAVAEPVPETAVDEQATSEETTQSEGEGVSSATDDADATAEGDTADPNEEQDMAEGDIEIREGESLAEIKERMKREQKQAKKPAIPPELLNNANSYEDKVGVVRMVVQADHSRVASLVRSMIQDELQKGVK
jgi:hypothetical protein